MDATIDPPTETGPPRTIDLRDRPSNLRVRRATSADLNTIADLWVECGLVPGPAGFRNEMQRKLLSDPELFLVAVDTAQGAIIGALLGGFDGRTATVSRMATNPARRREGVARALVAAFDERLARLGGARCRVVLLDEVPGLRELWIGLGHTLEVELPAFRLA